ncbi:hypothetical protein DFH09DRAFT_1311171 [Mycena vulgaris]|nr:hypothetical protein DFH09DRAFT_1311171 [Mycena vulgaris]
MAIPSTDEDIDSTYSMLRERKPNFPSFVYCYLYGTKSTKRRVVPVTHNYGTQKLESIDQLFIHAWVPAPSESRNVIDMSVGRVRITTLPGSAVPLEFAYTIYFVPPGSGTGIPNACGALKLAGSGWYDNILVIKHGKRKAAIHVEREDAYLVDSIVRSVFTFPRDFLPAVQVPTHTHQSASTSTMGGSNQKKRKAIRQAAYDKDGKRMRLQRQKSSSAASAFFFLRPLFITEFLAHCDLVTIMTLAQTGAYARDLVKAFFACNLRLLVATFLSDQHVDAFFLLLETSLGAIGGSVVSSVLSFPYRHSWTPSNLNIFIPHGGLFAWHQFLGSIGLFQGPEQPGVNHKFAHTTSSHLIYRSKLAGFTITLTESVNGSVLTLLCSATTTWCTNLATCSDFFVLYVKLANEKRALEGWFPMPVKQALTMGRRHIRSSISTTSWDSPCGLHCPVLWRELCGFEGVGVFRWGGDKNQHKDGVSTMGIPSTDNAMKWRLGDTCNNQNCRLVCANYFGFSR